MNESATPGHDAQLEQIYAARSRYAASLGPVSGDLLAPLINPSFAGGPMWPDLRQAWRVIRRGENTIVMSDGLADSFSQEPAPNAGFELEVLGETSDPLPDQVQASWLFELVYGVSQQCAHFGTVRGLIDDLGLVSLELPGPDLLQPVATANSRAGVLLGVTPPDFAQQFDVPGGTVRIVTAKLLWPTELKYAAAHGDEGRRELARRFAEDGTHHRSSLVRKPVV